MLQNNHIEQATSEQLDDIWNLIHKDARWLAETKNLRHWEEYYTKELISSFFEKKKIFILIAEGEVIGCIAVGEESPSYYPKKEKQIVSTFPKPRLFLSTFAIDPAFHDQGYATELLAFIEQYAKDKGYQSIYFDCRAEDTTLVNWYKKRGYIVKDEFSEWENESYYIMQKTV